MEARGIYQILEHHHGGYYNITLGSCGLLIGKAYILRREGIEQYLPRSGKVEWTQCEACGNVDY